VVGRSFKYQLLISLRDGEGRTSDFRGRNSAFQLLPSRWGTTGQKSDFGGQKSPHRPPCCCSLTSPADNVQTSTPCRCVYKIDMTAKDSVKSELLQGRDLAGSRANGNRLLRPARPRRGRATLPRVVIKQRESVASINIKQMNSSKLVSLVVVVAFASIPMAFAVKNGFDTTTTCVQGHSTNPCQNDNGTETTTTGPHGQIKQGKDANTDTTNCGPGNSTGC